jgi:6-phosphogluconolactonase (cycloisomerase 2 family)
MVITTLVTWTSGTPAVASISNAAGTQGDATAASAGTTLITATYPGTTMSGSTTLTVKNAYAYATNTNQPNEDINPGTISQYSIGLNGQLTALPAPNATIAAGYFAFSIAINPAGTYAYVANYNKTTTPANSTIFTYQISQATGALTQIGSVVTASNPNSVTIDPFGSYVYVSNNSETDVSEFVIQPDGTLANPPGVVGVGGAIFPSGAGPSSIAINPADRYAYVANYGDGTVSQYVIGAGGALAVIPGEPATVNAQSGPSYVIVDPSGRYVYVANQGSGTISEYNIGADGALVPIGAGVTPYSANTSGQSFLAIDAAGTYLYAADSNSDNVAQYAITAGGANAGQLTLMATYSTGAGSVPYGLTIDATGKWLYVADRITAGVIHEFAVSAVDGTLTPLAPAAVPAGAAPTGIATTP